MTGSQLFVGQVAVITGASRGLGRAYALELARQGCQVVVNDLPSEKLALKAVVKEIESAGGRAVADAHDVVSDPSAIIAAPGRIKTT